ncbi:MAG: response regulator [Thermoflexales bacterium]|nr:response regulator [Thermoflexales bacterium]
MRDTTRNILIVEDEAKVAFFLQESLESIDQRYQVVRVASGEEALDELARGPFDLVVSDLRMSGINGLDLLKRVREQNPSTQTILITAYGSDEVEAETRRLQTYRYFTKPFRIEEFTAAVKDALNNEDARRGKAEAEVLSASQLEQMTQRLSDLRYEVGAQCVLLSNETGEVLGEAGFSDQLRPVQLVALMGSAFFRGPELARQLREDRSFNLHYHEGTRYDIYTANVGERLFITLVFDRRQGASRIGMVWLYAKRAIQDLLYVTTDDELLAHEATSGNGVPLASGTPLRNGMALH